MSNGRMSAAPRELQALFAVGVMGNLSDGELLGRFVEQRGPAVFEAIMLRHGPMVWGVCRRVLRDHHDAEDAFQATFLVLARKAASVLPREKLGNWLYGVAYQTAMKARATRAKRQGREAQVPYMPEPAVEPEETRDDLDESLNWELSRLPEAYRIAIVLCDLEGRSHKEAASQLGWPVGTVSSRLSRARAMLARRLSRPGVTLTGGMLAILLARESASAGVPTRLIGSSARTASLIAAGRAMSAGVVPAGVAALTREVMKAMLLSKIKVVAVLLVVTSVIAVGGAGLAYRAQADELGRKDDLRRRIAEKREEFRQLIAKQKGGGQPREVRGKRTPTTPRVYQVADLIQPPNRPRNAPVKIDMNPLIDLITTHIDPETWEENGGDIGSIAPVPETMSLVVRHNHEVQDRVETLLDSLRLLEEAQATHVGLVPKEANPKTKPAEVR